VETQERKQFATNEVTTLFGDKAFEMDYANRMRDLLSNMNTFKPAIKSANLDTMLLQTNINDDMNQIRQLDRHIKQVMHANPIPAFYNQPCSQEID
jgi:hypothetical protein